MTLHCPHCGRTIHLHVDAQPPSLAAPQQTVNDLSLSSRAMHFLDIAGVGYTSPPVAVLAIEYPHRFKNFGKTTYMEIVAVLEAEAGYSREQIMKSMFWKTANSELRRVVDSVRFDLHKEGLIKKGLRQAMDRGARAL